MRALMRFIDEMPAAAVRVPTFNLAFLPRFAKMNDAEFIAFAESRPLRQEFMLAMGHGLPGSGHDFGARSYAAHLRSPGGCDCSERRPFLQDKQPTLAEIALMAAVVRIDDLGSGRAWTGRPAIVRWFAAIRAENAFTATYYPGSLLSEIFPHLRERATA